MSFNTSENINVIKPVPVPEGIQKILLYCQTVPDYFINTDTEENYFIKDTKKQYLKLIIFNLYSSLLNAFNCLKYLLCFN